MTKYTYPGSDNDAKTIGRYSEAEFVDLLKEHANDQQKIWDRAHAVYLESLNDLRDRIWHGLYGDDCPFYEHVDTMEVASMRVKTYDILDAILK